jgi:hypothetical protein
MRHESQKQGNCAGYDSSDRSRHHSRYAQDKYSLKSPGGIVCSDCKQEANFSILNLAVLPRS